MEISVVFSPFRLLSFSFNLLHSRFLMIARFYLGGFLLWYIFVLLFPIFVLRTQCDGQGWRTIYLSPRASHPVFLSAALYAENERKKTDKIGIS